MSRNIGLLPICAFPSFTPGLGTLGSTGGSSGTNGSSSVPSENPRPTEGTTEPGHQQFIQQMLQALAAVNPQVVIFFADTLHSLMLEIPFPLKRKWKERKWQSFRVQIIT